MVSIPFDARKPSQGMDHLRDYVAKKGILEECMIQVYIGGHPPIPLRPPPLFHPVSLIVGMFIVFGVFLGPKLSKVFRNPKKCFFGK